MKTVNIKSLIEICEKNNELNIQEKYEKYLSGDDYELKIKNNELDPLKRLIENLEEKDPALNVESFNCFYIGYKIPQIGKEFDLIRISESIVLNIEYKKKYTSKVKNQLLKNYYYLKFLEREIKLFTYVEEENELYEFNDNNLIKSNYCELIKIIKNQSNEKEFYEKNLNDLFRPSNYLISPFMKTKEFINGDYFLTNEQEEIKQKIIDSIKCGNKYFLITGGAGTGKTLLTYDLAKKYKNDKYEISIIHCGNLNSGHEYLNSEFGWNVHPIKFWNNVFNDAIPKIIIIDEMQRMNNASQFSDILKEVKNNKVVLIMSGDEEQTLRDDEGRAVGVVACENFNLKGKIRSNKELSRFIKVMLNLNRKNEERQKISNKNINIVYFNELKEANKYISSKKDYQYISYTPNTGMHSPLCKAHSFNFPNAKNSHCVVGQEFENVIVILDEHFYYENNKLKAVKIKHNPYSPFKMFFQQITRAINKLEIVVVGNMDVFKKLIEIFE